MCQHVVNDVSDAYLDQSPRHKTVDRGNRALKAIGRHIDVLDVKAIVHKGSEGGL